MGLDITITQQKKIVCPKCGEVVGYNTVDYETSGGKAWYSYLESIGYYVPYEERTEENDWYGKDMTLTDDQVDEMYAFLRKEDVYGKSVIMKMIAIARFEHDDVVVNADW